jgi:cell division protein FtsQ
MLGAAALVSMAAPSARGRAPSILVEIEWLAEMAGFGLQQVAVSGHRFTPDGDIFEAVGLGRARTLLTFDPGAARERLERLPWVERATIERIIPDRLEVTILERAPFAVWRVDGRAFLIDKSGRVLSAVAPDAMRELPRLAGEGAPNEAEALVELLARHPGLGARVGLAERIGGRRWTLHLAGGGTIELPASGESEALARAMVLTQAGLARTGAIDFRAEDRTLLRTSRSALDRNEPETGAQDAAGRS